MRNDCYKSFFFDQRFSNNCFDKNIGFLNLVLLILNSLRKRTVPFYIWCPPSYREKDVNSLHDSTGILYLRSRVKYPVSASWKRQLTNISKVCKCDVGCAFMASRSSLAPAVPMEFLLSWNNQECDVLDYHFPHCCDTILVLRKLRWPWYDRHFFLKPLN
jgi:hypothetical protein